jgi:hypothetical protein
MLKNSSKQQAGPMNGDECRFKQMIIGVDPRFIFGRLSFFRNRLRARMCNACLSTCSAE